MIKARLECSKAFPVASAWPVSLSSGFQCACNVSAGQNVFASRAKVTPGQIKMTPGQTEVTAGQNI